MDKYLIWAKIKIISAYRVVFDTTRTLCTFAFAQIDSEVGFEAAPAEDAAAGLRPVGAVNDSLERLLCVDPDGHGAADTTGL